MNSQMKQRIIGGIVLLAILAIFLPLLFHNTRPTSDTTTLAAKIPPAPDSPQVELQLPNANQAQVQANTNGSNAAQPTAAPTNPTLANNPQAAAQPTAQTNAASPASTSTANPGLTPVVPEPNPTAAASTAPAPVAAAPAPTVATAPPAPTPAPTSQPPVIAAAPASAPTSVVTTNSGQNSAAVAPVESVANNTPVNTPAPVAPAKHSYTGTHNAWVVQLGSFAVKAHADDLVKKLRAQGFAAYSQTSTNNGHDLVRVMVGPEISLEKMQEVQQQINAQFKLHGVVRKYKA